MCHSGTFGTQREGMGSATVVRLELGGRGGGVKLATVVLLERMEREWEEAQWYFWNSGEGEEICHSGAFGTQGKGM
jgi:hypothetical protein